MSTTNVRAIARCMVRVVCQRPSLPDGTAGPKYTSPGVALIAEDTFCYIVAARGAFVYQNSLYSVVFPDGSEVELRVPTVNFEQHLAAFYVRYFIKKVNAVAISDVEVPKHGYVHMFTYAAAKNPIISPGTVTHADTNFFCHDCPAAPAEDEGSPLFNDYCQLVGITYYISGCAYAINIDGLRKALLNLNLGMNRNMTITDILQSISSTSGGP